MESDGTKSGGDEEVKTGVRKWLHQQPVEFYEARIYTFIHRCNTAVERRGEYVKM